MTSRDKETLKKIHDGLSEEQKLCELMLKRLSQAILHGNKVQAGILAKAIIILFPKSDVLLADTLFEAFWRLGKHKEAIRVYRKAGRLFWHSEEIGRYYEKQGQMAKAAAEYEYLMNQYSKMGKKGILPLPNGPREIFVLGKWYASRDKVRARRYLALYLRAEKECGNDPAFRLQHKNEAKRLLNQLEGSGTKSRTPTNVGKFRINQKDIAEPLNEGSFDRIANLPNVLGRGNKVLVPGATELSHYRDLKESVWWYNISTKILRYEPKATGHHDQRYFSAMPVKGGGWRRGRVFRDEGGRLFILTYVDDFQRGLIPGIVLKEIFDKIITKISEPVFGFVSDQGRDLIGYANE